MYPSIRALDISASVLRVTSRVLHEAKLTARYWRSTVLQASFPNLLSITWASVSNSARVTRVNLMIASCPDNCSSDRRWSVSSRRETLASRAATSTWNCVSSQSTFWSVWRVTCSSGSLLLILSFNNLLFIWIVSDRFRTWLPSCFIWILDSSRIPIFRGGGWSTGILGLR